MKRERRHPRLFLPDSFDFSKPKLVLNVASLQIPRVFMPHGIESDELDLTDHQELDEIYERVTKELGKAQNGQDLANWMLDLKMLEDVIEENIESYDEELMEPIEERKEYYEEAETDDLNGEEIGEVENLASEEYYAGVVIGGIYIQFMRHQMALQKQLLEHPALKELPEHEQAYIQSKADLMEGKGPWSKEKQSVSEAKIFFDVGDWTEKELLDLAQQERGQTYRQKIWEALASERETRRKQHLVVRLNDQGEAIVLRRDFDFPDNVSRARNITPAMTIGCEWAKV